MIKIVKLINNELPLGFYVSCSVYYKKDNNPSIEYIRNFLRFLDKENYVELEGIFGYNIRTKEIKDLDGNIVDPLVLVKLESYDIKT